MVCNKGLQHRFATKVCSSGFQQRFAAKVSNKGLKKRLATGDCSVAGCATEVCNKGLIDRCATEFCNRRVLQKMLTMRSSEICNIVCHIFVPFRFATEVCSIRDQLRFMTCVLYNGL